ncbi:MAG: hypothetical protein KIH69_015900 [Anaerolineae bacterium]|nr:hypothetical protein [Anaerolineae bacterium]
MKKQLLLPIPLFFLLLQNTLSITTPIAPTLPSTSLPMTSVLSIDTLKSLATTHTGAAQLVSQSSANSEQEHNSDFVSTLKTDRRNADQLTYFPIVMKLLDNRVNGIYGNLTLNNQPAANIEVMLRRYVPGSNSVEISRTKSDTNGKYVFLTPANLTDNQRYYVAFNNESKTANGYLGYAGTADITASNNNSIVDLGRLELADFPLHTPADKTSVSLPANFTWFGHDSLPKQTYKIVFLKLNEKDEVVLAGQTPYLGHTYSHNLTKRPNGVDANVALGWFIFALNENGAVGESFNLFLTAFKN